MKTKVTNKNSFMDNLVNSEHPVKNLVTKLIAVFLILNKHLY